MDKIAPPTGTVTFLFTDIEGSTRMWQEHQEMMSNALEQHHSLLKESIISNGGYVFQITGDAFCAAFATATDGLNAALTAQRSLRDATWGDDDPIRVRMALHTGPIEMQVGDYTSGEYVSGFTLSKAARILSAGHGGQILLSLSTAELVKDYLPLDVTLRDMGAPRLRDLMRSGTIYQVVVPDLRANFPALITLDVYNHNLPLQITSFVGRSNEMAQVREQLMKVRLLTLTGAAGCGKTRLALQVAAKMLDSYPEGVWLVELGSISDPMLVLQTISTVLGIREQSERSPLSVLQEYVCDKCLLLVLDNCDHLINSCADVTDSLLHTCPNLSILATSREVMGIDGEHVYTIQNLPLPGLKPLPSIEQILKSEAVHLLLDRIKMINPKFELTEDNKAAIAQICHRLDGIPLAIELAAARMKLLSPEEIANRLDNRFKLLTKGRRTALPHHQTLEALIDWSHDLLSDAERALFRRLSIFSGGWTLDAAEAIMLDNKEDGAVIQTGDVLDLLAELVNKSLAVVEELNHITRYRLLETIRAYSQSRLRESEDEEPIQRAHLVYYLDLVKSAEISYPGEDYSKRGRKLEPERDNLRRALIWAFREPSIAADFEAGASMIARLFMYWYLHGNLNEGRHWLTLSVNRYKNQNWIRATSLTGSGIMAWQQGDYPEAGDLFEESIQLWSELGEEKGLAEAQHYFGHLSFDQCDYVAAKTLFGKSMAFYQEIDDTQNTQVLMSDMGLVAYHLGDYQTARLRFEEVVHYWRERGNQEVMADMLNRLGDLVRIEDDYDLAKTYYDESLGIFRNMKAKLGIASGLHKLGQVARYQGDIELSEKLLVESLILQQESGNKQGIVECLAGLAGLALSVNEPKRASVLFGASQSLLDAIGAPMAPADRMVQEQDMESLQTKISTQMFTNTLEEGNKMTQTQAIEYALKDRI